MVRFGKKRGTIGVPAPTGQGVAAAAWNPQVVAAKGVTDAHGHPPPQPTPVAIGPFPIAPSP
jgi:hypothetical protein